jgi:hypothetical protein
LLAEETMTKNFRTLLLLGFTALAGMLSGCIVETSNGPGPGNGACLTNQYFAVQWEVDTGNGVPLTCGQSPDATVVLTTNASTFMDVGRSCQDGTRYNWTGITNPVAAGTIAVAATLFAADGVTPLSSVTVPPSLQVAIPNCNSVLLTFEFPLL